jgi:uncharacterized protein (TIGR03067 family)
MRSLLSSFVLICLALGCGRNPETAPTPASPAQAKAPAPEAAKKTDKELIQGTWTVVTCEQSGQPSEAWKGILFQFSADELNLIATEAKGRLKKSTFRLNPQKNPKEIDIVEKNEGKIETSHGIYKLEGDTLTLCINHDPGGPRPTAFATAMTEFSLVTFKRAAK